MGVSFFTAARRSSLWFSALLPGVPFRALVLLVWVSLGSWIVSPWVGSVVVGVVFLVSLGGGAVAFPWVSSWVMVAALGLVLCVRVSPSCARIVPTVRGWVVGVALGTVARCAGCRDSVSVYRGPLVCCVGVFLRVLVVCVAGIVPPGVRFVPSASSVAAGSVGRVPWAWAVGSGCRRAFRWVMMARVSPPGLRDLSGSDSTEERGVCSASSASVFLRGIPVVGLLPGLPGSVCVPTDRRGCGGSGFFSFSSAALRSVSGRSASAL